MSPTSFSMVVAMNMYTCYNWLCIAWMCGEGTVSYSNELITCYISSSLCVYALIETLNVLLKWVYPFLHQIPVATNSTIRTIQLAVEPLIKDTRTSLHV